MGVAGDTVLIEPTRVMVNEEPLDEPWAHGSNMTQGRWEVPPGHVFVLSDARDVTRADSRSFGPVSWSGCYLAWFRYRRGGN